MNAQTIKTRLHYYRFDISDKEQAANYEALKQGTLRKLGFPVWVMDGRFKTFCKEEKAQQDFMQKVKDLDGQLVELDTTHLFDNQWNAKEPNLRLFNWGEMWYQNAQIKSGYWLEQTAEMAEVLRNTHKCGYCGKQEPAQKGYTFCPHCIGSEYLTRGGLHLTRMVPVCDTNKNRAPLTEAEEAHLLPIFKEAQTRGITERDKARIAKQRADIAQGYEKATRDARIKRDGLTALMDLGLKIDNVIFYEYTGVFSFGWRAPVDALVASEILDVISAFPFPYEIKCADGRTLSGNIG